MKKTATLFVLIAIVFFSCSKDDDTPFGAPVALDAQTITASSFVASWEPVSGAVQYEVQVTMDSTFALLDTTLKNQDGTTVSVDAKDNAQYYYRVRAANEGGDFSSWSNVIGVHTLPLAPYALNASNVGEDAFRANWEAVEGIEDYLLYVSTVSFPNEGMGMLPDYNGVEVNSTAMFVTGLQSMTLYYYVVRSASGDYISKDSNSISVFTQ